MILLDGYIHPLTGLDDRPRDPKTPTGINGISGPCSRLGLMLKSQYQQHASPAPSFVASHLKACRASSSLRHVTAFHRAHLSEPWQGLEAEARRRRHARPSPPSRCARRVRPRGLSEKPKPPTSPPMNPLLPRNLRTMWLNLIRAAIMPTTALVRQRAGICNLPGRARPFLARPPTILPLTPWNSIYRHQQGESVSVSAPRCLFMSHAALY